MNEAVELPDPEIPDIDDDIREPLMARTAELLGVPVRACPVRACWRSGACRYVDPEPAPIRPWCVHQLTETERAGFEALYTRVRAALIILLLEAEPLPSPDPETRELQDAALEIVATVLCDHPANRPAVRRWIRRRRDNLPALLEGDALKAYRAAVDAVPREMLKGLPWML
ncbi:hypothetical protein [Ciceribacter selenitireducens]|uniref:Uncharacterized protein n=1 Tax=Ciceribacter selenitireducens ATCC BAA-1503 TaxID=1336235 RepID=A0A376AHK1_9HYPH|nr:hypothetical protein [Ciceribacter selenitireducens]SSC67321.1 unnamed protein product [Ciceribacter selenitireducens ATCC BAA-1503]